MTEWILFGISALLTLFGIFAFVCAQLGLQKWNAMLLRMHATAVGDTVGLLSILAAVCIAEGLSLSTLKLAFLAAVWLFASPTSSHLLAQIEAASSGKIDLPDETEGKL